MAHSGRIPVTFLAALDAIRDEIEGLAPGDDDYVTKPFDFMVLLLIPVTDDT